MTTFKELLENNNIIVDDNIYIIRIKYGFIVRSTSRMRRINVFMFRRALKYTKWLVL